MSSFVSRTGRPQAGDTAYHPIHEEVTLIGELTIDPPAYNPLWVVKTFTNEIVIVEEDDLYEVGYFGE